MMNVFESRLASYSMALLCCLLLMMAYYFEYFQGMEPCPLCIFQRIGVFLVGLFFFLKALHHPVLTSRWNLFYSIMGLISTAVGGIFAARHTYIKSLPADQVPACGPDLEYLREMLPPFEVISAVLAGDGECAKDTWSLLGLSMPAWVLIFFIGIGIFMLWNIFAHFRPEKSLVIGKVNR